MALKLKKGCSTLIRIRDTLKFLRTHKKIPENSTGTSQKSKLVSERQYYKNEKVNHRLGENIHTVYKKIFYPKYMKKLTV